MEGQCPGPSYPVHHRVHRISICHLLFFLRGIPARIPRYLPHEYRRHGPSLPSSNHCRLPRHAVLLPLRALRHRAAHPQQPTPTSGAKAHPGTIRFPACPGRNVSFCMDVAGSYPLDSPYSWLHACYGRCDHASAVHVWIHGCWVSAILGQFVRYE